MGKYFSIWTMYTPPGSRRLAPSVVFMPPLAWGVHIQWGFNTRVLGACTFRGGKRWLAFPVKHKMLPSQQSSFRIFHVNRAIFHTKHCFRYVFFITFYDTNSHKSPLNTRFGPVQMSTLLQDWCKYRGVRYHGIIDDKFQGFCPNYTLAFLPEDRGEYNNIRTYGSRELE